METPLVAGTIPVIPTRTQAFGAEKVYLMWLIHVKGLTDLGTSHSLGVPLFQGASRIIISLNKD